MTSAVATRSTARTTARGAAYNYGAQLGTVVLQFGYAALTSRLLGPEAFGTYSAGLISAGLVTQLAIAGIPQAVTRLSEARRGELASLLLYSVMVGVVAGAVLFLSAPLWGLLWGTPGAADVVRLLSLNAFCIPLASFATGLALRAHRFRLLATTVFLCNLVGMVVGGLVVLMTRIPEALVVSVLVAQLLSAGALLVMSRGALTARPSFRTAVGNFRYSFGLSGGWAVSYIATNLGRLTATRVLGHGVLGHWNRAEVLTTVPFYQVQNAMVQALYPQFRRDREDPTRAQRLWADLLGLVAWLCLPAAAMLAVGAPVLVHTLFGSGWEEVEAIAPVLALVAGVQALAYVLVGALEVLGRIAWLWQGYLLTIVVMAAGSWLGAVEHSLAPILVALLVAVTAMHLFHLVRCARAGLVTVGALLRHYGTAALAAVVAAAAVRAAEMLTAAAGTPDLEPVSVVVTVLVLLGIAVALRRRMPPVLIARKHGIL